MTLKARREREKQERYEEIVDAAEKVFFSKSYEQTSMDEIARAAGLSRALLYVYFKDKSAIMRGVMLRALLNGMQDSTLDAASIVNPLQTAFYLQGALHGVIMQTRGPKSQMTAYPDPQDLIKYTIAMLTTSIRA